MGLTNVSKLAIMFVFITLSIWFIESQKVSDSSGVDSEALDLSKFPTAPDLVGISGYINADESLQISDLRGKVVLVDFWTYTCINCIRTLPHLRDWYDKYADDGLVIIGVHTPEFTFEKDYDNVLKAVREFNVSYSVVLDNDYLTWRAYSNRYWPHKYLIDKNGLIRYDHIGEGAYEETEKMIQELLSETGTDVSDVIGGVSDLTPRVRQTPELYAGFSFNLPRGQDIGNVGGLRVGESFDYVLSDTFSRDTFYLDGVWSSNPDGLVSIGDGVIVLDFTASIVNIVAEYLEKTEGVMKVFVDDEFVEEINVVDAKLYKPFIGEHGNYLLRIEVSAGFSFNAFTFG